MKCPQCREGAAGAFHFGLGAIEGWKLTGHSIPRRPPRGGREGNGEMPTCDIGIVKGQDKQVNKQ